MRRHPLLIAVFLAIALALPCDRPAGAQSPAPAPAPDALAAARELVTASRAADSLKTLFPVILQQLKPAIVQGRPEVERDFDAALPQVIEAVSARSEAFVDSIAIVYAHNFSVDELQQLTAFYRGPIGQKFLEKMPAIAQESMAMGQKFGQEIAGDFRNRMIEELRKRGHNI
jgi:hypothetical protein